jgi:alpha-beta hydrolase superfamily lysophospholipase
MFYLSPGIPDNINRVGRLWNMGMAFAALHSVLEPLTFSIEEDSEVTNPELKEYLEFYSIDFAKHYDVSHRMGNISAEGFDIATHYWHFKAARGTVYIFHGHFDHVGLYGHIIRWCLSEHYNVVAIDFPGHGLSTGKRASIESFDQYGAILTTLVALCSKKLRSPHYCIGQGTGAAAIMNMMWVHGKRPFAKMAFLAPLVRPQDWSKGNFKYFLDRIFSRTVKRRFVVNSGDDEFIKFVRTKDSLQSKRIPVKWITAMKQWAAAFPSRPTEIISPLVIQGTNDITMDWKYNTKQVAARFPNGTVKYLVAANHHLANETEGLRNKILQEIKAYFDPSVGE